MITVNAEFAIVFIRMANSPGPALTKEQLQQTINTQGA
jgi:hypothetical protein